MSRASRDPKRSPQNRRNERKACARKVRYSKLGAELAAAKLGDRAAYRCEFCEGWHVAKKRGLE